MDKSRRHYQYFQRKELPQTYAIRTVIRNDVAEFTFWRTDGTSQLIRLSTPVSPKAFDRERHEPKAKIVRHVEQHVAEYLDQLVKVIAENDEYALLLATGEFKFPGGRLRLIEKKRRKFTDWTLLYSEYLQNTYFN